MCVTTSRIPYHTNIECLPTTRLYRLWMISSTAQHSYYSLHWLSISPPALAAQNYLRRRSCATLHYPDPRQCFLFFFLCATHHARWDTLTYSPPCHQYSSRNTRDKIKPPWVVTLCVTYSSLYIVSAEFSTSPVSWRGCADLSSV